MKRILLGLALTLPCPAQPPVRVHFLSDPPVESVRVESALPAGLPGKETSPSQGNALSLVEGAFQFRFDEFRLHRNCHLWGQGQDFKGSLSLQEDDLRRALHCESAPPEEFYRLLRGQVVNLPATLQPVDAGAALRYWSKRHAGILVVGLGGCLAALGLVWDSRRKLRLIQRRAAELDQLIAGQDRNDPFIGALLGGYRMVGRLGAGGMATVYRAVPDQSLDATQAVAIKIITPDKDSDDFRSRFEREIKVSMTLDHPNVVRIINWGWQDGLAYMVMELVSGQPLSKLVPKNGLPVREAMKFYGPFLEALIYAHKRGIVHRDLKPENAMVTDQGRLKLMDFGLARSHKVETLTAVGAIMGTPYYMAPEQIQGDPARDQLNLQSDQYAMGVILFELLCGQVPFKGEAIVVLMQHMTREAPSVREFNGDISPELAAVIAKSMLKSPAERYPSVSDYREALRAALRQEGVEL